MRGGTRDRGISRWRSIFVSGLLFASPLLVIFILSPTVSASGMLIAQNVGPGSDSNTIPPGWHHCPDGTISDYACGSGTSNDGAGSASPDANTNSNSVPSGWQQCPNGVVSDYGCGTDAIGSSSSNDGNPTVDGVGHSGGENGLAMPGSGGSKSNNLPLPPPPPPGAPGAAAKNPNPSNPNGSTAQNPQNQQDQPTNGNPNGNANNNNSQGTSDQQAVQQATNQAASDACASAFALAHEACKGPLGGGMDNGTLIQTAGQVGSALEAGGAQATGTAAGVAQNCSMGAHIAEIMAGGFAVYSAACSAAQSSCVASCTGRDMQSIRDQIKCQGYAAYTQKGLQGLVQYGSTYLQAQNCVQQAKALQAIPDCTAAGASSNPQCATDCQVAANQSSAYCQTYFATNPCQAPGGLNSKACFCSQNPSNPTCTGVSPAASPIALSASPTTATPNSSLLAQFANQGNPGGLNRNPLYKGNAPINNQGFGKPLSAQGQGGGLPNLGGGGSGMPGSGSGHAGAQDPGYNTNINKGFVASNAVLPVPLSAAGGGGAGANRAPASVNKPFTFASLQKLLPSFAGAGGFHVVSKYAPNFRNPQITPANGLSNWQKVHLQYLRMAADHELMP